MNLRRLLATIVLCSWTALAQSAGPRQAQVPAPPFVISSPTVLSPEELLSAGKTTTIKNLTANKIRVTVTTTLEKKGILKPLKDTSEPTPIPPWGTIGIPNVTTLQSITAWEVLRSGTASSLSLNLEVKGATYTDTTEIHVAYPTAATATALLPEWNIRRVGARLENAVVPVARTAAMSCRWAPAGWLQGVGGALQVIARPVPSSACELDQIASGVDAIQLSLKAWPSGNIEAGEYSGTLTLPTDGETAASLKLTVQSTWSIWAAAGCILAGVLVGLFYRWWSDVRSLIQRDLTDATRYQLEAQKKAEALRNSRGAGQRLGDSFSKVVCTEYKNIEQKLKQEQRRLSRDPVDVTAMAQRLAIFQSAPDEYEKLVQALDKLERLPKLSDRLGSLIGTWLASDQVPALSELRTRRTLAESYVSFHGVWTTFESTYSQTSQALQDVEKDSADVLKTAMGGSFAPLALQVARGLTDTAVNLSQARHLLDTSEPTLDAASDIRGALARATGALQGASIDLERLPVTQTEKGLMEVDSREVRSFEPPIFTSNFRPIRPETVGEANYRKQRVVLGWSNFGLAVASLALALLIGLNLLYLNKTFGVAEAWQAFAWGLGTKLGLDALYVFVDRLMRQPPTRTVLTTP